MLVYVVSIETPNSLGWSWFYTEPEAQKELNFYKGFPDTFRTLKLYPQSVPDGSSRREISREVHDVVFNVVEHT